MSSRLVFSYRETKVKPDLEERIYEAFKTDFGYITSIPVTGVFKKKDGSWTSAINMTFDTGAAISLLPKWISKELEVDKYAPHELTGISKKPECLLPVNISRVTVKLLDIYGEESPEFELWVAFADRDDVPTILGMKDVVSNFRFESDPKEKKLYLIWGIGTD